LNYTYQGYNATGLFTYVKATGTHFVSFTNTGEPHKFIFDIGSGCAAAVTIRYTATGIYMMQFDVFKDGSWEAFFSRGERAGNGQYFEGTIQAQYLDQHDGKTIGIKIYVIPKDDPLKRFDRSMFLDTS